MDLILWRHAEAEEGSSTLPDKKRRLTARGENQAKQVARWLRQHLPRKRRVIVSPAERMKSTGKAWISSERFIRSTLIVRVATSP